MWRYRSRAHFPTPNVRRNAGRNLQVLARRCHRYGLQVCYRSIRNGNGNDHRSGAIIAGVFRRSPFGHQLFKVGLHEGVLLAPMTAEPDTVRAERELLAVNIASGGHYFGPCLNRASFMLDRFVEGPQRACGLVEVVGDGGQQAGGMVAGQPGQDPKIRHGRNEFVAGFLPAALGRVRHAARISRAGLGEPSARLLRPAHRGVAVPENARCLVARIFELLDIAALFAGELREVVLRDSFPPSRGCREVLISVTRCDNSGQHFARHLQRLHQSGTARAPKRL